MNREFFKKYQARKRSKTFLIERSRREISRAKRRASRSSADLLGGDFVCPGGEAFLAAIRFHVEKQGGRCDV